MDTKYTLSLALLFVSIFSLLGYLYELERGRVTALRAGNDALLAENESLRAQLDLVYSKLPDPHQTAFGDSHE